MSTPVSDPVKIAEPAANTFSIRFPPFPAVPEGVTIIPFKDFKEHGIQLFEGDDEIETDGLGIPTVALRVKHETDFSKTNPNRKRKTAKEMAAARGPGFRKEWWEDWEEGEDLRNHGPYNANAAAVDRFHQAAADFQKYRKFPPTITNVQALWDQFKIFTGLLGTTPVWQKASEKPAEDADVSDDDFEDEDSKSRSTNQGGERRYPARLRPRAPYELYGKTPALVEDNEDIKKLLDAARATKEDRIVEFLNDPARGIQVFLSSYMKYQGFVYADRNLITTPHLLRFFVNYLLRNKVLPDKTTERSLRSALEIIDVAGKELPLTAKLAKLLPDDFSVACQSYWGRRLDALDLPLDLLSDLLSGEINSDAAFELALMEENVEMIKQEDVLAADPTVALSADDDTDTTSITTTTAPSTPIVPVPNPDTDPIPNADADADADTDADAPSTDAPDPADASTDVPWHDSTTYDPASFTPPPAAAADAWSDNGGADTEAGAAETDWAPPPRPSLFTVLGGPTALPLTHTPGIVEWSVRRIKSIMPPMSAPAIKPVAASAGAEKEKEEGAPDADPEAVERDLEERMARVVLTPWVGCDADSPPRVLRSSVGALAESASTPSLAPNAEGATATPAPTPAAVLGPGGLKPHDMLKDDITLLVDPTLAESLCVGMGLGGTWVQLARLVDVDDTTPTPTSAIIPPAASSSSQGDAEKEKGSNAKPKKKKALTKAQKERRGLRYWYLDEHMMVLPSYWLV